VTSVTDAGASQAPAGHEDILVTGGADGVLMITFNRPAQRNAMTPAMEQRFLAALRDAEKDDAVRVVVLTGAAGAFCAGADLAGLQAVAGQDLTGERPKSTPVVEGSRLAGTPAYPLTFSKPIVAAINGAAIGLGFSLAVYADIRFAASDAKIASAFARRGLIAEYGTAWLLPRIVGRANALDLLLSGRTILGEEAQLLGLVQFVLPADEVLDAALTYARELASNSSPTSMAIIKEQVNLDGSRDLEPAVLDSLVRMLESFARPDLAEGVAAHVQRRTPAFAPWRP
jgi:enoyl-CoA hydratase/carnithine racemase